MCRCEKDDKECKKLFAKWNICWGAVFTLVGIIMIIITIVTEPHEYALWHLSMYGHITVGPLSIMSGIFIIVGDSQNYKYLFLAGMILSNFMPLWNLFSIFLPIVHFVVLCRVCKYYRIRWP